MQILSSVVADYAFNALWEVALVVMAGAGLARLLNRANAAALNRVWAVCLALAVVLPALSLVSLPEWNTRTPGNAASLFDGKPGEGDGAQAGAVGSGATLARTVQFFRVEGQGEDGFSWRQAMMATFFWLYVGSVMLGAVRLLRGLWRTRSLVLGTEPANLSPGMRTALQRCLKAFGMPEIEVVYSARGSGPATLSWPRPMMILPAELGDADAGEMEAAFCHELAHLRRRDFALNLIYEVCGVLLFFHPAMHWAMRRLRETREMACDEMAAEATSGRSEYARSLLKLAQRMSPLRAGESLVVGVFDEETLERRVMNLIEKRKKQTVVRMWVSASVALGLLAGVLALSAGYGLKPAVAQAATTTDQPPEGWFLAGSKPASYRTGVDRGTMHDQLPSAYLASRMQDTGGFGTLMQEISATRYAGRRIRLRGWVQAKDVSNWAGLWMRVDKGSDTVGFDNMEKRPIQGNRGWAAYDVVLDVPKDATGIAFGVSLTGPGEVWMNDVKFDVVGPEVKTTGGTTRETPENLGFEK